jgi:hypothetical protein
MGQANTLAFFGHELLTVTKSHIREAPEEEKKSFSTNYFDRLNSFLEYSGKNNSGGSNKSLLPFLN